MAENLLYPLIVSALVAVGSVLARDRTRAALERRITFYAEEEGRYPPGRYSESVRASRIRVQARLTALDHVRQTAATPAATFLVLAGFYLFVGARSLGDGSVPASGQLGLGLVCGIIASHTQLSVIRYCDARRKVVEDVLKGSVPSGPLVNPLEDFAAYRATGRAVVVYILTLAGPTCLGLAVGLWTEQEMTAAILLVSGVGASAGQAMSVAFPWRRMDRASCAEVSTTAMERLRRT